MSEGIWSYRPEYQDALIEWQLIRDLLGGTRSMRGDSPLASSVSAYQGGQNVAPLGGSTPWLPRFPTDSDESYTARWYRAILFGAFADAISRIAAKPFQEPISIRGADGVPLIAELMKDADRRGTSLHQFEHANFGVKAAFGASHTMVTAPGAADIGKTTISEADRRRYRMRPFMQRVHPMNVVAWEFEDVAGGMRQLAELRIRADRYVPDGQHGWAKREILHVYTLEGGTAHVETITRLADDKNKREDRTEKRSLGLPVIPLVPDLALSPEVDPSDFELVAPTPCRDLAWLNLQHFMETAEQGVSLFTARAEGILELGCPDEDEAKRPLDFGLGRAKRTTSLPEQYDLKFVGPSGKGVELGQMSLEKIEARMARLHAQALTRQTGGVTATGTRADESKTESVAESWARATEDCLERKLRMAVWIEGGAKGDIEDVLPDLSVDITSDFGFDLGSSLDRGRFMLELSQAGIYSKRALLEALQALKLLQEDADIDQILEESAEESAEALSKAMDAMDRRARMAPPDQEEQPEVA